MIPPHSSTSKSGMRAKSSSNATRDCMRAAAAPRQWWAPRQRSGCCGVAHVELAGVGAVHTLVAIGGPVQEQHLAVLQGSCVADPRPGHSRPSTCAGEVGEGTRRRIGNPGGGRSIAGVGRVAGEQLYRSAEHSGRGVVTAGDHREGEARIDSRPAVIAGAHPGWTRCETVSPSGSTRRRAIRAVK